MLGTIIFNNNDQEMQSKMDKQVKEYLGKLNVSKLARDETDASNL